LTWNCKKDIFHTMELDKEWVKQQVRKS